LRCFLLMAGGEETVEAVGENAAFTLH